MKVIATRGPKWGAGITAAVLLGANAASAATLPYNPSPFDMTGYIDKFSLTTPGDVFSAARMTVNGTSVLLPRNTLITFPAAFFTPEELFTRHCQTGTCTQTGLARQDGPAPLVNYEASIQGNRVGKDYIAGLVSISQEIANVGQGFINSIDYATGEMRVGGTFPSPNKGTRVMLNDPAGRYGRTTSADPRFTSDDENPTIHATTGYPMCVPRTDPTSTDPAVEDDPLCPQTNRPLDPVSGTYSTNFTMPAPGAGVTPDATQQAPFEVGDFITYSGTLAKDANGIYVSAHTIDANLGIFTAPGTKPAYIAVEDALLSVAPNPAPPDVEAKETLKVVLFTTDPTQSINIFAIDVDPCTGAESLRFYGVTNPQGPTGRERLVVQSNDPNLFLPATREFLLRSQQGTIDNVANGLVAGQYRTPIGEYIFTENLILGAPLLPLNFEDFPFLAQGAGPYNDDPTQIRGQLSPWPGAPAPVPVVCPAPPPPP